MRYSVIAMEDGFKRPGSYLERFVSVLGDSTCWDSKQQPALTASPMIEHLAFVMPSKLAMHGIGLMLLCCLLPKLLNKLLLFWDTRQRMLFHAAVSNLNRAKAVSVLGVCASCSSKPLRAPAGGAFCQMSVYLNSCVDEVLLLTEPQFLELCFSLSGMLFGENTLKSCLSSGSPFFSVRSLWTRKAYLAESEFSLNLLTFLWFQNLGATKAFSRGGACCGETLTPLS